MPKEELLNSLKAWLREDGDPKTKISSFSRHDKIPQFDSPKYAFDNWYSKGLTLPGVYCIEF